MIVKVGRVAACDVLFRGGGTSVRVHLMQNNPGTADQDLVLGDLSECDFPGYAYIDLQSVTSAPTLNGSDEAESDSSLMTWTEGPTDETQTAYGVYLSMLDLSSTRVLLAVYRFPTPQTVNIAGDVVQAYINVFAWNGVP